MNLSFYYPSNIKANLLKGNFDSDTDTFQAYLMRAAFAFNASNHLELLNFTGTTGDITYDVDAATKTFSRGSGSFIADGFVVGNRIITTHATTNVGPYTVTSVSALSMRVALVDGSTIVDQSSITETIQCEDEHATAGGYTRGGIAVTLTQSGSTLVISPLDLATDGDFGSAISTSTGFIICKNGGSDPPDPVMCWAKFSPWTLYF